MLCEDLDLPMSRFMATIAESIRQQVVDFEAVHEVELPPNSIRVVINVSQQHGKCDLYSYSRIAGSPGREDQLA